MATTFPTTPVLNQIYNDSGDTWIWDGSSWQILTNGAINAVIIGNVVPDLGNFTTLTANSLTVDQLTANSILTGTLSLSGNVLSPVRVQNTVSGTNFSTVGEVITNNGVTSYGNITAPYYIGDGSLLTNIPVGTNYSNANVAGYLPTYTGNLQAGNITVLGNIASGNLSVSSNVTVSSNIASGNLLTGGMVSANGNIVGNHYFGNGAFLTGISSTYSNANVEAYLPTYSGALTGANLSVSGNITGNNISVNGNVLAVRVISASGNVSGGNITTSGWVSSLGNVSSPYYFGNGAFLTGLSSSYSNANVAAYLPTYTGNISAGYFIGDGSQLTNLPPANYSNANVGAYLTTYTGIVAANVVSTTGNITGNYIIGNGALLTGIQATEVGVLTTLSVTGNTTTGNLSSLGVISSIGNISTGNTVLTANLLASRIISAAGNIIAGNISAVGQTISAGNITVRVGSFFIGNGSLITGVNAVSTPASGITGNILSPNVTTSSLQSVGTLGSLSVSGTITTAALNATTSISSTGNIIGNRITANVVSTTGNITGSYFVGNGSLLTGIIANTSYSNANVAAFLPNYTGNVSGNYFIGNGYYLTGVQVSSIGVLPNLSVTGNIVTGNLNSAGNVTASYFKGDGSFLTGMYSNVNVAEYLPVYGGNVLGNFFTGNGRYLTGVIAESTYSNANVAAYLPTYTGNLAGGNISVTGRIYGNGAGITYIPAANINGTVASANTVTNPTQSNITSLGTLTSLSVSGNISGSSLISTTGNVVGGFFIGDGSQLSGIVANVVGVLTNLSVTGNTVTGNLSTGGAVSAAGNITGGNLLTGGLISATSTITSAANITGGNILTAGLISATSTITSAANITGGNILTAGLISATSTITSAANITGGNILTAGAVSATGNVTGNYLLGNGALITGLPAGYANSDVAAYLASGTDTSNIITTANLSGGNVLTSGVVSATGNVTGNYIIGDGSQLTNLPSVTPIGNAINMGSNTQGSLVSNAVTLTANTTVTNGIALLNQVLGKLVPPAPTNFPGATTLSISSLSTYRMANFTQTDNTPGANKSVAGGTTVTTVRRAASYSTNTVANVGPGDSGTVIAVLNGADAGNVTLTSALTGNGTYSNLVITNNYDYSVANANITSGFWSVFTSQASGSVSQGWNEVRIADTATANTNTPSWYYDASAPGTPGVGNLTISASTTSVTYSSTVGHYNSATQFTLGFTANRLSGDMYPTSNTFVTGTAGGSFQAPVSVTYATANVTTPLSRNLYVSSGAVSVSTTANIVTGFGASTTGPSVSVLNSYATGTGTFTSTLAANVLYKTGTASTMEESNVVIGGTIGSGSGAAFRIDNPGSTDTPAYTGSEAAFNSTTGPLQTYDATIVAAVLKHDQTNYSTGYLPAGPDLSSGRSAAQYFTFKIQRSSVSKFDVKWTGTIAGLWVALPGSLIDSTSTLNGWLDMSTAYGGAGAPGANTGAGGNGSNGCALGTVAPLNSAQTNRSITATFGTVSSTSATDNEIYIRIKLTSGQSVTALSLQPASN